MTSSTQVLVDSVSGTSVKKVKVSLGGECNTKVSLDDNDGEVTDDSQRISESTSNSRDISSLHSNYSNESNVSSIETEETETRKRENLLKTTNSIKSLDELEIKCNVYSSTPPPNENPKINKSNSDRTGNVNTSSQLLPLSPKLVTSKSLNALDDEKEFTAFAGDWNDSRGQLVKISPWGVIRYPNNPKLRFEAEFMGPNHLSVIFDKDPKRRKFVGKLNHDCDILIWSNDTKWTRSGYKKNRNSPKSPKSPKSPHKKDTCLIM